MWTMLLPYLTDSPFAYPLYILILALGIVVVGRLALGLIPNDATDSPIYRHIRMALISFLILLVGAMLLLAVLLSFRPIVAPTAFGSPLAPPVPESFEERPAQRHYQTRYSHHRHAEDDDGDDEYRIVFQVDARVHRQRGNEHNRREDVTNLLHPLEILEPAAVIIGGRRQRRRRRFGVGGRLRAFAGDGGGVTQFGGSHNRAILDLGRVGGQNPVIVI